MKLNQDYINKLRDIEFQLNGGWTAVIVKLFFAALKYAAIGALFGFGWRLVR